MNNFPEAPSDLLLTSVSFEEITLSWTDNSDNEDGFKIERAHEINSEAGSFVEIGTVNADTNTYNNTGLTSGTNYYYKVYAFNKSGNSDYSNIVSTNGNSGTLPEVPDDLSFSIISSSQIDLSWNDNSDDETGFRIERAPDNSGSAGTFTQIVTVAANITTYSDDNLQADTYYYYRVRAYNSSGNSAYTSTVIAKTLSEQQNSAITINHNCTDLSDIPDEWINAAKDDLHIVYQHTSHGSQLVTGMTALESYPSFIGKYSWDDTGASGSLDLDDYGISGCSDLSTGDYIDNNGVTPWVTATRNLLDNSANSHVNVVVWSWCSISGHDAQRYVDNMEILISEYPDVKFVFMTGHSEGQGETTTVNSIHYNNQLIRQHCSTHNRILFDFADIEAYDPDGIYYWNKYMHDDLTYNKVSADDGNWGTEWIAANVGTELEKLTTANGVSGYNGCLSCAHSGEARSGKTLNCVLKGRASWWLWARLAGWDGNN